MVPGDVPASSALLILILSGAVPQELFDGMGVPEEFGRYDSRKLTRCLYCTVSWMEYRSISGGRVSRSRSGAMDEVDSSG